MKHKVIPIRQVDGKQIYAIRRPDCDNRTENKFYNPARCGHHTCCEFSNPVLAYALAVDLFIPEQKVDEDA